MDELIERIWDEAPPRAAGDYRTRTTRRIPVFELRPDGS
jgi:hypothetical protein